MPEHNGVLGVLSLPREKWSTEAMRAHDGYFCGMCNGQVYKDLKTKIWDHIYQPAHSHAPQLQRRKTSMRVNEEIEFIDDKHRVILRTRCKQDEEFADSYMLTPRDITRMVEYLKARL